MDTSIKAFCSKCFMTFEAGKKSSRALKHSKLPNCDKIPCSRKGSGCIRKFSSINSANRHTYCYTKEQVDKWQETSRIPTDLNLNFENLHLSDVDEFFAVSEELELPFESSKGSYKYANSLTASELFIILQRKTEIKEEKLLEIKNVFISRGYSSAEVIRAARMNQGNWEFIYREIKGFNSELLRIIDVFDKILAKRLNN